MLKHSSVVAAVGGFFDFISDFAIPTSVAYQETYLAYLPAAHILEFAVETGMLAFGAAVREGATRPLQPTTPKAATITAVA